MRIVILNWRDIKNPSSGGAEILTHEMAKRWVKKGHSVTQFSSAFNGCKSKESIDGVTVVRRGQPGTRSLFGSVHFLAFLYYQKNFKGKVDVVIDEVHGLPFFTPWYVREKKVALICEVADELWVKVFGLVFGTIGRAIEILYLRYIYKNVPYLTISESTKKDLINHGVNKNNITVLPMGVSVPNPLSSRKKESSPTLVFVGRLSKQKGIEDALYALKEVKRKVSNIKLWIIGRGEELYLSYLKMLSTKLHIQNDVVWFGFVSDKEKFELMGRSHILVHPSIREGFGLTIPEAGFVGTPVVAYNSPGIRDTVKNNINGILLTRNSPGSIAKKVTQVLKDKEYYEKLRIGAKRESLQYSWDTTAKTVIEHLQSLQHV